jgi:hypothetical protein
MQHDGAEGVLRFTGLPGRICRLATQNMMEPEKLSGDFFALFVANFKKV